jgi:hypothetical protein
MASQGLGVVIMTPHSQDGGFGRARRDKRLRRGVDPALVDIFVLGAVVGFVSIEILSAALARERRRLEYQTEQLASVHRKMTEIVDGRGHGDELPELARTLAGVEKELARQSRSKNETASVTLEANGNIKVDGRSVTKADVAGRRVLVTPPPGAVPAGASFSDVQGMVAEAATGLKALGAMTVELQVLQAGR